MKEFNSIDAMLKKEVKVFQEIFQFGLSILHGWIRFFECLLQLAYKLPLEKWRVDKQSVSENKSRIQAEFQIKMGLIIDQPKAGFGNSNDGNTARRIFENADTKTESIFLGKLVGIER